jgi:hypothetical protein
LKVSGVTVVVDGVLDEEDVVLVGETELVDINRPPRYRPANDSKAGNAIPQIPWRATPTSGEAARL